MLSSIDRLENFPAIKGNAIECIVKLDYIRSGYLCIHKPAVTAIGGIIYPGCGPTDDAVDVLWIEDESSIHSGSHRQIEISPGIVCPAKYTFITYDKEVCSTRHLYRMDTSRCIGDRGPVVPVVGGYDHALASGGNYCT